MWSESQVNTYKEKGVYIYNTDLQAISLIIVPEGRLSLFKYQQSIVIECLPYNANRDALGTFESSQEIKVTQYGECVIYVY